MTGPHPLDDIKAKLTEIEATAARLIAAVTPIPHDEHRESREAALGLLHAVDQADPGVWLPLSQVASYRHDRLRYRDLQLGLAWLVENGHAQRISVAQRHATARLVLLRLHTEVDAADVDPIAQRINAELAPLGHRIEIHPARPTLSHFHRREVTLHTDGTTYTCYRRWHRWEPRLERIEPEGT